MSYIRITEFVGAHLGQEEGEWYTVEGREASVRIDRGEAALDSSSVSGACEATRWTGVRLCHRQSGQKAPLVYMLKFPVPLDYLYEFDAWFQYEHMPMILEEPTWYGCEFFRSLGASCYSFAALQYVEPQALKSDARNRSVDTPWWHRLKKHDWFDKQFTRTLMRPVQR